MSKTLKFLVENICEYLLDLRVGNIFLRKKKKKRFKKLVSLTVVKFKMFIKRLCSKNEVTKWEKMLSLHKINTNKHQEYIMNSYKSTRKHNSLCVGEQGCRHIREEETHSQ